MQKKHMHDMMRDYEKEEEKEERLKPATKESSSLTLSPTVLQKTDTDTKRQRQSTNKTNIDTRETNYYYY